MRNKLKSKALSFLFFALLAASLVWQKASAVDRLLSQDAAAAYAGARVDLSKFIDREFIDEHYADGQYLLSYKWNAQNPSPECAVLGEDGNVDAISPDTVLIDVTCTYQGFEQTETLSLEILGPEQVQAAYGEARVLAASQIYDAGTFVSSGESVAVNDDGSICARGFDGADIYAIDGDRQVLVANVAVSAPSFSREVETRAKESDVYMPIIDNYSPLDGDRPVEWESDDGGIAAASNDGIRALAEGQTQIYATITPSVGESVRIGASLIVTDPTLDRSDFVMAKDTQVEVSLGGIVEQSLIDWGIGSVDQTHAYFIDDGILYAGKKGQEDVIINADGRELVCSVLVTAPRYVGDGIVGYKGVQRNIKIKGTDKERSQVSFKSSDESIAVVSQSGIVRARGKGNAFIIVDADGLRIKITVEIAAKKAYMASRKAINISETKTNYSQANRMGKSSYDCSSLVWRVYSKVGAYFGVRKGWAPTAAEIGRWCDANGKRIFRKNVSSTKLLPGDVVFFSFVKNGRYKNISHVEIYAGKGKDVSASSSRNAVVYYPYSRSSSIVMIARPFK